MVEDLKLEAPKTKEMVSLLGALRGDSRKTMLILPEYDTNVYMSARNLQDNKTVLLSDVNTYDLVNAQMVIFTETAAKLLSEVPAETAE